MHLQVQSHIVTKLLPVRLHRDVFGNEAARDLLLLLVEERAPVRYSEARRRLDAHPQTFQRALETLEQYALVGLRVETPDASGSARQPVVLEATATARFLGDVWARWTRDYDAAARKHAAAAEALALLGR